jgi:hypothetical protein
MRQSWSRNGYTQATHSCLLTMEAWHCDAMQKQDGQISATMTKVHVDWSGEVVERMVAWSCLVLGLCGCQQTSVAQVCQPPAVIATGHSELHPSLLRPLPPLHQRANLSSSLSKVPRPTKVELIHVLNHSPAGSQLTERPANPPNRKHPGASYLPNSRSLLETRRSSVERSFIYPPGHAQHRPPDHLTPSRASAL